MLPVNGLNPSGLRPRKRLPAGRLGRRSHSSLKN